ncbi:MAG TPA: hypothetical protein VJN48_17470 [Terriglobales bacterium]|nr:hypothetical protein [Terriglobales bacterium]
MKFAPIAGLLLASLLGCGTPGVPLPPSLDLPQPVLDLRASRKGDTVTLFWTVPRQTTDRTNIRRRRLGPTRLCRSLMVAMTQCTDQVREVDTPALVTAGEAAAEAKAKANASSKKPQPTPAKATPIPASATDFLPRALGQQNPTGFVHYAVETLNIRGHSAGLSNQVQVPLAPTLPPPTDLAAQVTADGVLLTFTSILHQPPAPELSYVCRVFREQQGSATPVLLGELQPGTSPQTQFVDRSLEWQKTYRYWVTVVTQVQRNGHTEGEVEGDNSAPVTVSANDVFPPAVPAGLQAVFSSVGQQPYVDLTWAPNTDSDLAGYNVYRRENNAPWTRINSALLPTPAYRDGNVAAGRTYFYAVTAVDVHGNESVRSPEAKEEVPSS